MDALIAEKVLGWSRGPKTVPGIGRHPDAEYIAWYPPDGGPWHLAPPASSTRNAVAWQVLERYPFVHLMRHPDGRWRCSFMPRDPHNGALASTAALAICRAALLALEVPTDLGTPATEGPGPLTLH